MKKILFVVLLASLTIGAFAQIDISAGIQLEGGLSNYIYRYEVDADNYAEMSQSDTLFGFGAFVDATYVRLSLAYSMSLGATQTMKLVVGGSEDSDSADSPDGYSWTNLNIGLLGKYPISLGSVIIWPAAGLLYRMTLAVDYDGDGETEDLTDTTLDDFYVSIGCGADIEVTQNLYVTLSALFHWNLTPIQTDYEPTDEESYMWYIISGYIGVGWKF